MTKLEELEKKLEKLQVHLTKTKEQGIHTSQSQKIVVKYFEF